MMGGSEGFHFIQIFGERIGRKIEVKLNYKASALPQRGAGAGD